MNSDIPYDEIDIECRPMVKLFNDIGLTTKFSCQGHDNYLRNSFNIMFDDSVDDNAIINFISLFSDTCNHSPFIGMFLKWTRKMSGNIISNWMYQVSYGNYENNIRLSKIDYDLFYLKVKGRKNKMYTCPRCRESFEEYEECSCCPPCWNKMCPICDKKLTDEPLECIIPNSNGMPKCFVEGKGFPQECPDNKSIIIL